MCVFFYITGSVLAVDLDFTISGYTRLRHTTGNTLHQTLVPVPTSANFKVLGPLLVTLQSKALTATPRLVSSFGTHFPRLFDVFNLEERH